MIRVHLPRKRAVITGRGQWHVRKHPDTGAARRANAPVAPDDGRSVRQMRGFPYPGPDTVRGRLRGFRGTGPAPVDPAAYPEREGRLTRVREPRPWRAFGVHSAPAETTTGPPAPCGPRRRAPRSSRAVKSGGPRPPDGAGSPRPSSGSSTKPYHRNGRPSWNPSPTASGSSPMTDTVCSHGRRCGSGHATDGESRRELRSSSVRRVYNERQVGNALFHGIATASLPRSPIAARQLVLEPVCNVIETGAEAGQ